MKPRPGHETVARFLGSTAAAFPLTPDPWASLAHGLGLERGELAGLIDTLQEEGIVAGIRGEPNPVLPGSHALLVNDPPPGGIVRWEALLEGGGRLASVLHIGPPGKEPADRPRFLKCGFAAALLSGGEGDPLGADTDRTVRVPPDQPAAQALPGALPTLRDAYLAPVPMEPRADFWEWFGHAAALEGQAARQACREILLGGHWRRLAVAVHPTAAGLAGCGMAWWHFSGAGDAGNAAAALASLRCTADVMVLPGGGGWKAAALFAGRGTGEGRLLAGEVARQWGRDMARWEPFERLAVAPASP